MGIQFKRFDSKFIIIDHENLRGGNLQGDTLYHYLEEIDKYLDNATQSTPGLMSSTDKVKLDSLSPTTIEYFIGTNLLSKGVNTFRFEDAQVSHDGINKASISIGNFIKFIEDISGNKVQPDDNTLKLLDSDTVEVVIDGTTKSVQFNVKGTPGVSNVYTYNSNTPSTYHIINHNLNSFNIRDDVLVEDFISGGWSNDIVSVRHINPNQSEIWLTESANIIATFEKVV